MFLRFNFFPRGLELFAPCRSGLYFSRCFQKVADGDRQSEAVARIQPNTLSLRGKGRFCLIRTEYRGHSTAANYLCIVEK